MPPRRPNPKKDKSARRQRSARPGTFTAGFLDPSQHERLSKLTPGGGGEAPPESLLPVLLTVLWAGMQTGSRANNCVGACRTIGHALGELGIPSELRAAQVTVTDRRTGATAERAPLIPAWENGYLRGHCVLTMPTIARWADPTIEQFPQFSAQRGGPAVGRFGGVVDRQSGALQISECGGRLPAGAQIGVRRGDLLAVYTLGPDSATDTITRHTAVSGYSGEYRQAGLKLAAITLAHILEDPKMAAALRRADHPRAHALLDAIAGASRRVDGPEGVRFVFTGDDRELTLDRVPIPGEVPPAVVPA